jgi:O-antigen ligase
MDPIRVPNTIQVKSTSFGLALCVAIAFSWFGQSPPHGEFERDSLVFGCFFAVLLVFGLVVRPVRMIPSARACDFPDLKNSMRAPTLGAACLIVLLLLQFVAMPSSVWWGRNWLTIGWLLTGWLCMALGALTSVGRVGQATSRPQSGKWPGWGSIALGLVLAATFNALLVLAQTSEFFASQSWFPMPMQAGRPGGALLHTNLTANLLILGSISLAVIAQPRPNRMRRFIYAVSAVSLGAALFATGSRIGLVMAALAWFAGLGCWLRIRQRDSSGSLGAILLCSLFGLVLMALLTGVGFVNIESPLARGASLSNGRWLIFDNAVEIGRAFPILGAGWGQLSYWHVELPFEPKAPGYLTHAHNLFLHFWAEMGLLGVVWLSLVVGAIVWSVLKHLVTRGGWTEKRVWSLSVLLVVGFHSMVELPLWSANFFLLSAYVLGVWLGVARTENSAQIPVNASALLGQFAIFVGSAGLVIVAWIYIDYAKASSLYEGGRANHLDKSSLIDRAQSTMLFKPTVEFALANQAPINVENAAIFSRVLPSLWRYAVDPRVFEWQLTAAAWQKDSEVFRHYALKFQQIYPTEYLAFTAQTKQKGTAPWLYVEKYWP